MPARMRRLLLSLFLISISLASVLVGACGPDRGSPGYAQATKLDASTDSAVALRASADEPVVGVDDGRRDPPVVWLGGGGRECTATLVAGDAVLTSSVCVGQADSPADALEVRVTASSPPAAFGARVIVSDVVPTVGASFAVVLLDRPLVSLLPTWMRTAAVISGEHLRTVGFEASELAARKMLRDHLAVVSTRLDDFALVETPCGKSAGAPAFDEDTEELVGIALNPPPCTDPFAPTVYARVFPARDFVEKALAQPVADAGADAGKRAHGSKGKADKDFGEACEAGADCSTGVCVEKDGVASCSRGCGTGDRCATGLHCQRAVTETEAGVMVCAEP